MQKLIALFILLAVFQSCHDDVLAKNTKSRGTVKRNPKPAASQGVTNQGGVKTDKVANQGLTKRNTKPAENKEGVTTDNVANPRTAKRNPKPAVNQEGVTIDKISNEGIVTNPKAAANQGLVKNPRVAIIGNTLSGAMFSYYLRKLHPNIVIHVYEHIDRSKADADISVHTNTQYMREIIKDKNLKIENYYPEGKPLFYDGVQNNQLDVEIFKNKNPELDKKLSDFLTSSFKEFSNIYKFQKEKKGFKTVNDLLTAMSKDFEGYLYKSANELFDQTFGNDENWKKFFEIMVLRAYLQKLDIHAFAGLASVWFSELTGSMEQIVGEYNDTVKKLFDEKDIFFKNKVSGVYRKNNKNFIISSDLAEKNEKPEKRGYDFVIIAESDADSVLNLKSSSKKNNISCEYNRVLMTMIYGLLKKHCFKIENSQQKVTNLINIKNSYLAGTSVIKPNVWCIVSYEPLEAEEILNVFNEPQVMAFKAMEAFPKYSKYECVQQAKFDLGRNIYHINCIAWATSTTEMLAIGAKNVALLINSQIA